MNGGGDRIALMDLLFPLSAMDLHRFWYHTQEETFRCRLCQKIININQLPSSSPSLELHSMSDMEKNEIVKVLQSHNCVAITHLANPAMRGYDRAHSFANKLSKVMANIFAAMGLYLWGTKVVCVFCDWNHPLDEMYEKKLEYVIEMHTLCYSRIPVRCDLYGEFIIKAPAEKKCSICADEPISLCLLDCGHVLGKLCRSRIECCPICRTCIKNTQQIYL